METIKQEVVDVQQRLTKKQQKVAEMFKEILLDLSEKNDISIPDVSLVFCHLESKEDRGITYYLHNQKLCIVEINKKTIGYPDIKRTLIHEASHVLQFKKMCDDGKKVGKNKHNCLWRKIFNTSGTDCDYDFDIYA